MKNIYLVGFMGTGKTAVGRITARLLSRDFVDLDISIETLESSSINDIFRKKGEVFFRDLETKYLNDVSQKNNLIVACGGGIVIKKDNIDIMKNTGLVICLKADASVIFERVKLNKNRPLLNVEEPLKRINELLEKRRFFYGLSDFQLDTSSLSEEQAAGMIVEIVKNNE
ncbi:MAG: shikimate kinase [Candidatus Gygaella obscura]|nr:shikimate kinase [Candidatus Gygaella obscura]